MPVRRAADPASVQNVWDAIRFANHQKQMADNNRITKYLQKTLLCSPAQAELYLKQTLQDGLILAVHKVTAKGSKAGSEVESYKIPSVEPDNSIHSGHDWYCIDCHLAGDVSLCVTCHRVFHAECANKNQKLFKKLPKNRKLNNSGVFNSNGHAESLGAKTLEELNSSSVNGTFQISADNEHDIDPDRINDSSYSGIENNNQNEVQNSSTIEDNDAYYDEAVCSICNMSRVDEELPVEQDEVNYLLTFIFSRIKTWIPADISNSLVPSEEPSEWYTDHERKWRCEKLFYENVNVSIIEHKLEAKEYREPHEFKADMLTLQHNIAVYHGSDTEEYRASELLLKDCLYEISELLNCVDCYKYSNEKENEDWFCTPCRIPHKLVWAKQQGHPYWPSKVLRETDKSCDVRFFGGKYERALLSKTFIKPINVNINSLNIKRTPGFNKAVKELHLHQKLLKSFYVNNEYGENVEENRKPDNIVTDKRSRKRKSSSITCKTPKNQRHSQSDNEKRSHSVDKLSENNVIVAKTAKRRNSLATFAIAKSRGNEYSTRQSMQKLTSKKKKNHPSEESIPHTKRLAVLENHTSNGNNMSDMNILAGKSIGNKESCSEPTSSSEIAKISQENSTVQEIDSIMPKPERQYSESVETTRRKLEGCLDREELIKIALECMQAEIDKIMNENDVYIKRIFDAHNNQISETKKKQWCYNCEQDAIYHCCWNTAYCSLICQQQHWQAEHKKVCRRKR